MSRKQYRLSWTRPGKATQYKTFGHRDALLKTMERLFKNDPRTDVGIDMREVGEWAPAPFTEDMVKNQRRFLGQSG